MELTSYIIILLGISNYKQIWRLLNKAISNLSSNCSKELLNLPEGEPALLALLLDIASLIRVKIGIIIMKVVSLLTTRESKTTQNWAVRKTRLLESLHLLTTLSHLKLKRLKIRLKRHRILIVITMTAPNRHWPQLND